MVSTIGAQFQRLFGCEIPRRFDVQFCTFAGYIDRSGRSNRSAASATGVWIFFTTIRSWTRTRQYSFFLISIFRYALFVAIIFVGKEFSGHEYLDAVALCMSNAFQLQIEIDGGHNSVAELFLDQGF
jgi:hypothetical protein